MVVVQRQVEDMRSSQKIANRIHSFPSFLILATNVNNIEHGPLFA